jgi:hypothetical protein
MLAGNVEASPLVCTHLRTKGGWVPYGERVTWDSGFITSAIFWCIETGDPVGPDDGPVHPHRCIAGRACYCDVSTAA